MESVNLANKFKQIQDYWNPQVQLASDELHVLLIERKCTLNTGNLVESRTIANLQRL